MPIFKVFGRKYQDFYSKVDAKDGYEAIDIANAQETHKWFMLPDDDTIEAVDVYLDEQSDKDFDDVSDVQLNNDTEDDFPQMESGILIEGK